MNEKRRDKRFKEENRIVIKYVREKENSGNYMEANAVTHDISIGGARLRVEKFFPVGSAIRIQLNLSRSGETIKVDGNVKWVKKTQNEDIFEMGVEFLHNISRSVLSLIRHLYGEHTGVPSSVT